ncbi:hypothetical protein LPJ81_001675 [Coemansia sp. IMI 209127]|nr:hypothetical protein LPJ81_001675 [Coemansia sp. IMI 209127]
MAVDTRGSSEEYAKTIEYVRRLCEGDDTDASIAPESDDAQNIPNGSTGGGGATPQKNKAAASPEPATPASTRSKGRTNGTGAGPPPSSPSRCGPRKQVNGTAVSHDKPGAKEQLEHDTCDACDQPGQFVCCDLCPRVFHFYCANPPMSREAVSKIDHWFCRECAHRASGKRKSRAHVKNVFYPLISDIEFKNPRVFAVPDEIRRQFDGVERDIDGAFINVREDRPQRVNGGQANRDFTRLVDDHNETIMCYRCGLSALHGLMVRCDYCPLNWHWDCLDPPLCSAPPPHKRWMCPNHADHAMRRHRKFRKERIIDLTDAPETARNNGIIDIIDDDPPPVELFDPKVKYKVPSSRICSEFAKHAMPCVVALGIDQKSDLEPTTHVDTLQKEQQQTPVSSTLANSLAEALDTNYSTLPPPVMSVAEWLQSIVAFQQDVARFVMTTAKEAVLQETYKDNETAATSVSADVSKDDKIAILSTIAAQVLSPLIRVPVASNTDKQEGNGHVEDVGGTKRSSDLVSTADSQDVGSVEPKSEDTTGGMIHSAEESDKLVAASALEELPNSMVRTGSTLTVTSEDGKTDCILDVDVNTADRRRKCLLDRHGLSETEVKNAIECIIGPSADNSDDCNKRKHGDASPSGSVANAENVSAKRMRQLESREDSSDAADDYPKQEPLPYIHDSETPQQQYTNGDTRSLTRTTHLSELVAGLLRAKGADAILDFLAG